MILALKDLTVKFRRERIHTNEIVGGKSISKHYIRNKNQCSTYSCVNAKGTSFIEEK